MELTEQQVVLALAQAAIEPVELPATLAAAIGHAVRSAAPAFAVLPFDAEPPAFLVALARGAA